MKLKYYLMGLGIGIFVTTLVLSIGDKKEKLSDEEIIARARELGMVMEDESKDDWESIIGKSLDKDDTNKEIADKSKDDSTNGQASNESLSSETSETENTTDNENTNEVINSSEDNNAENQTTDAEDGADDVRMPEDTDNDNKSADSEDNDNENISETDDEITFTIIEGMTSNQVAELLNEIGLIEDAKDFDNYVIRMGKSTVIRTGTFTLHKNASYDEILKAITKSSLHN